MRLRFRGEDDTAAPPGAFDAKTNKTPLRTDHKEEGSNPETTQGNQKYKRQLPRFGARTAVLEPKIFSSWGRGVSQRASKFVRPSTTAFSAMSSCFSLGGGGAGTLTYMRGH